MSARTAAVQPAQEGVSVPAATSAATSRRNRNATTSTSGESRSTPKPTGRSASSGSTTTASASAGTTPTSPASEPPSSESSKQWRKPRDAKSFAAQANEVATLILNGAIDLDVARAYSGVARTMAQVLSAEVYRARFLQQEPNLSLEDES